MADSQTGGMKLSLIVQAVDRVTAPLRKINERIAKVTGGIAKRISEPFANIRNALGGLINESGIPKLAGAFANVGRAAGGVVKQVALIGGAVTAIGIGAVATLFKMVIGASNAGDAMAKLADRTGLSVNALAEYQFVAQRAGIEQEEFNKSLEQFNKRLGEARAGQGSMDTFLKEVSPKLLAQVKATKSTEQGLDLMFRALARIEDPAKRAAFAAAVFGRSGLKMANMVTNGVTEIEELRAEFRRIAGDQEKFARESEKFNDMWGDFVTSITAVRNAVLGELMPLFTDLSIAMREFVIQFREPIREWAAGFVKTIPDRLRAMAAAFDSVRAVVGPVLSTIGSFIDMVGGLQTVAIAIAAIIGMKLVVALALLTKAFVLLGWAMLTTPVGWFLLAVAAIAAAAYLIYDNWEAIAGFFTGLWSGVKEAFAGFSEYLIGVFTLDFARAFAGLDKILNVFGTSFADIGGALMAVGGRVVDYLSKIFGVDLRATIDGIISFISEKIAWLMNAANFISGKFKSIMPGGSPAVGAGIVGAAGANLGAGLAMGTGGARAGEARVSVDFENVPRGTKITKDPRSTAALDLSAGYAMQEAF